MKIAIAVVAVVAALAALAGTAQAYSCPPPGFRPFSCPIVKNTPPATDVLHLRPGNIGAVMALGDSITAGFAMKDAPLEYRGLVYSTGGDSEALTIGNFIAHYNPFVRGRAQGTTIPETHEGKGLNLAVSGAQVHDLPGQIDNMLKRMTTDPEFAGVMDEWKLLTIFIGANDVCDCHRTTPESFQQQLTAALTQVHQSFPRTFVNIMTLFNVSMVWDIKDDRLWCDGAVPMFHECDCLYKNATERLMMDDLTLQVNNVTHTVAAQFAALGDANFTVVVQPAVDRMNLNKFPSDIAIDFVSDLDCFHPSLCTDQGFAIGVWNNMFAPPAKKRHTIDPTNPATAYCPTDSDFIQ